MQNSGDDFPLLISDYIKKYVTMIGPSVATSVARGIPGLTIDDSGQVTQLSGDPKAIIENLKNEYSRLSGMLAVETLKKCQSIYPALSEKAI